jgi:holo-[acyl-carrier protein] synthase
MIYGIGTDIVAVERLRQLWLRHGERGATRLLGSAELPGFLDDLAKTKQPDRFAGRFLAKRFAAKEAFAKAIGTGLRPPVTLDALNIGHDALGKPVFTYAAPLEALMQEKQLTAQLSLSDEADYAVAFVIIETL